MTQLGFLAQGGDGCISVTANIAPKAMSQMHVAWQNGNVKEAQAINDRLMPLHEAMFIETNPSPVKYGASLLGKCTDDVRLPMITVKQSTKERVESAMRSAGLLN